MFCDEEIVTGIRCNITMIHTSKVDAVFTSFGQPSANRQLDF